MTVEKFKSYLKELGLSQEKFSELCGCNVRTVRRWLSGEIIPKGPIVPLIEAMIQHKRHGLEWPK